MIAIKDMWGMPSCCIECRFIHQTPTFDGNNNRVTLCNAMKDNYYLEHNHIVQCRPEWCPLIEIKENKNEQIH